VNWGRDLEDRDFNGLDDHLEQNQLDRLQQPGAEMGMLADLGEPEAPAEALTVASSLDGETMRALLSNRNFVPLWIGQMISYLGDQFMLIAALAVVTKLAGANSGIVTAGLGIANAAPQIVLGLIGGVLVDRVNRKGVMIISDIVRGIAMLSLLLVNNDPNHLWIFFVVLAVTGAASTMFYPARSSVLPAIISKRNLAGANALLEAGFVIALVFGSLLAGVLIQTFGPNLAFGFNGIAYFFSAFMISLMKIPKRVVASQHGSARQVWAELWDGLHYIWRTRSMRYIIGMSIMVSGSIGGVLILALDYLTKELKVEAGQYGLVIAILGLGIIIGAVLIQRLSRFLPTNRLVGAAIALNGLSMLGFVLRPQFAAVCILTAFIGFSMVVARAVLGTLTQAIPPEEYRGRVQGAFNLISSVPLAIAVGLAGLMVQLVTVKALWAPVGLPDVPAKLFLVNQVSNQWIVFAGFGIVLLLTAYVAVKMLRGIDEAIFSETT
jgi:DHA3 family macrolide efflux protein-like MFS transporter